MQKIPLEFLGVRATSARPFFQPGGHRCDLLWIRGEFLSSKEDFGKVVVHGPTPTREIEVRPNRINIDTGAFATGRLSCLVIEGSALSVTDTLNRDDLRPLN